MLFLFIAYHAYLIKNDTSTNEAMKRQSVMGFISKKAEFMRKWEEASLAKRPFKPSAASIEKYVVKNDIQPDMGTEELSAVREKV